MKENVALHDEAFIRIQYDFLLYPQFNLKQHYLLWYCRNRSTWSRKLKHIFISYLFESQKNIQDFDIKCGLWKLIDDMLHGSYILQRLISLLNFIQLKYFWNCVLKWYLFYFRKFYGVSPSQQKFYDVGIYICYRKRMITSMRDGDYMLVIDKFVIFDSVRIQILLRLK